jgi:hypothetical protein
LLFLTLNPQPSTAVSPPPRAGGKGIVFDHAAKFRHSAELNVPAYYSVIEEIVEGFPPALTSAIS